MANSSSFNGTIPAITKIPRLAKTTGTTTTITCSLETKTHVHEEHSDNNPLKSHSTRRAAISFASAAILGHAFSGPSHAEDNGFWIIGPIPVPKALNDINNEETGTRSFLKKGIYVADIGVKGRMHRLKKYAFDLLAMADLIAQRDAWNYVRRYLRLKSTSMYYDFDVVISAAADEDKKPLIDLANRLFDSFEKLEGAVRKQSIPQIDSCYQATAPILQEVMNRMG